MSPTEKEVFHESLSDWWSKNRGQYADAIDQVKNERSSDSLKRYEVQVLYPLVGEDGTPYFDESENAFMDTLSMSFDELNDLKEEEKLGYVRILSADEKDQHIRH